MSTAHHVKTTRELRSLYTILNEWVRLNRNIGRQWSKEVGDLPWWYNERALLSVFAGAVWRTGGQAFEEFSDVRHTGECKRKSKGRIDLWFETSGREFRAEAKHDEIPITNRAQQLASLQALMALAVEDARRNPADGHSRRLAIAFATPFLTATTSAEKRQDQVNWFLSLVEKVDHDAVAWVFPTLKKLPDPDGWVCPGIVIWIKIVKRSP